jgi:hypothetical protein
MKPIALWMCLQVKWLVSKTSSNRELISDPHGTESGTTALRHKNTSRQKSRFVPFGRVLHLFDGILRFFLRHNLFPKNVCYNPNISASTSRHLDCKMVGWYLLIVVGNMGMLGLPQMIPVAKNFASSSAIASCQAFGTETPWRKCVLWVVLPSRVVSPERNSIWAFELKNCHWPKGKNNQMVQGCRKRRSWRHKRRYRSNCVHRHPLFWKSFSGIIRTNGWEACHQRTQLRVIFIMWKIVQTVSVFLANKLVLWDTDVSLTLGF